MASQNPVEVDMTRIMAKARNLMESLAEEDPLRGKLASLLKEAGIRDDLFARASVLEGALGLPANSLARTPSRDLVDIQRNFPDINEQFFDLRRDYDLYGAVIGGASQIRGTEFTPDEIAQSLIAGLTIKNLDRVKGGSIYRRLGEKLKNQIKSGRVDMKGLAGTLRRWAATRAMDVIDRRPQDSLDEMSDGDNATLIDRFYSDPGTSETALAVSLVNDPRLLREIDRAVRGQIGNAEAQVAVWEAILANPGLLDVKRNGVGVDQQGLADVLSEGGRSVSRQNAGRKFREKVLPAMQNALANDERLQQTLMRDREIQEVFQDAMRLAAGYARKSMRGGDYGGAASSKQLVKDMIANMRRVKTPAERSHAVEQVQHAEAARSITPQQAKEVMSAINKATSARTAEWKGWTEDMPVQVVTMKGTEVFPNLAAAQKKYRDLDPRRNGRKFTWAMKDRVKGRPAIRFEAWDVNRMMSMSASSKSGRAMAGPWYGMVWGGDYGNDLVRFFLGRNKGAVSRWFRGVGDHGPDSKFESGAIFDYGFNSSYSLTRNGVTLKGKDFQAANAAIRLHDEWKKALHDFQAQGATTRSEDKEFTEDYAKNLRLARKVAVRFLRDRTACGPGCSCGGNCTGQCQSHRASEQEAEKLEAEAQANRDQAEADEAKAEAAQMKEAGFESHFKRGEYLYDFFSEKRLPYRVFEKEDRNGVTHFIPNEVVIETIALTRGGERRSIEDTIRKIDFKNGDVNHFLDHLAGAIADQYSGALSF